MPTGEAKLRAIAKHDNLLASYEGDTINSVNRILAGAYNQLEEQILKRYPKFTADAKPGLLPTQRALLLREELKEYLKLVTPDSSKQIEKEYKNLLKLSSEDGIQLANELTAISDDSFVRSTASIPIDVVAAQARDGAARLSKHSDEFAQQASSLVATGLALGLSNQKVASALRAKFGVTKASAETIARTESISASATAANKFYAENGIDYVQWYSTADEKACQYCIARNQQVYERGRITLPLHPRDRCYAAPFKLEWLEDGLIDTEFAQSFREQTIKESGLQPNYGVAPFEKSAGLTSSPSPVWTPSEGLMITRQESDVAIQSASSPSSSTGKSPRAKKTELEPIYLSTDVTKMLRTLSLEQLVRLAKEDYDISPEDLKVNDGSRGDPKNKNHWINAIKYEQKLLNKIKLLDYFEGLSLEDLKKVAKRLGVDTTKLNSENHRKLFENLALAVANATEAKLEKEEAARLEKEEATRLKKEAARLKKEAATKLDDYISRGDEILKEYAKKSEKLEIKYENRTSRLQAKLADLEREVGQSEEVSKDLKRKLYRAKKNLEDHLSNDPLEPVMKGIRERLLNNRLTEEDAKALLDENVFISKNLANSGHSVEETIEAYTEIVRMTNGGAFPVFKSIGYISPRASAGGGGINVGRSFFRIYYRRTQYHEYAHLIEEARPNILKASKEFLVRRSTGAPKKLNDLINPTDYDEARPYRENEIAYPDHFINPYVGKIYPNATEVLSVGAEHFDTEYHMSRLYRADPDHFKYTLGVLALL